MSRSSPPGKSLKKLGALPRKAVSVTTAELVTTRLLRPESQLPLVVEPTTDGVDLIRWAQDRHDWIEERVLRHGGVLFRGFGLVTADQFESFIKAVAGELLEYRERSTPRHQVQRNVYTSTDYPAEQSIFLHNENSYQHTFPRQLFFFCETPPGEGGETPIADVRRIAARIDTEVRRGLEERGILYVRNFGQGVGLSWQSVFQTSDRNEVEAYCRRVGMQLEWRDGDRLRAQRVLPPTARHPITGERVWFNHGTFFHVTTLAPEVREGLLSAFEEQDLPNNTYYGDGSAIEPEVLEHLREAYVAEKVVFPWKRGDLLMLDNMLTAHAREPFRGERKILTGMAHACTRDS